MFRRTIILAIIAIIGLAVSVNYAMIMVFLMICGMGIGGEITVAGTIMNEYLPPSKAWVFTLLCSSWAIGGILSGAMATGVVAANFKGIEL